VFGIKKVRAKVSFEYERDAADVKKVYARTGKSASNSVVVINQHAEEIK
jgi:hypothetical protein